jgi:SWI/SNF-related matrix-associated actin-dependent regulator 1 of chromatin subfamily A
MMRCYMLSGIAKLHSTKEYITSILQNDVKIVVFAHHQIVIDQLEIHIKSLKFDYIRLDGQVSP